MKPRRRNQKQFGSSTAWAVAALAIVLAGLLPATSAEAVNLVVRDGQTGQPITVGFRWMVEKDLTYHVPVDITGNPVRESETLSVGFHRSYMPVAAKGTGASGAGVALPALDPNPDPANPADAYGENFYVSVLPFAGYSIGGAPFHMSDASVNVFVTPWAIPSAQIVVYVHEDASPINGINDLNEAPLEGFQIVLEDAGGRYGMSAGAQAYDIWGNELGTEYAFNDLNGNGLQDPGEAYTLDADGLPIVTTPGMGITSGPDGYAIIRHLAPGKYGIQAVPPASQKWQQTSTIEGTKVIDAWVKANEPRYFAEFGPPGPHVSIGFVRPFTNGNVLSGGATISGQVVNLHMSRPPDYTMYAGAPFPHTTPWVALNLGAAGGGEGVYAAPCDPEGYFSIPNVPPGGYQLVVFDSNLDLIISFKGITVGPDLSCNGDSCNLGLVPVFQWFTRQEHWVFNDLNGDGQRQCVTPACDNAALGDEVGLPEQAINLRWRDGSMNQSMPTDTTGFVPFDQVFPFFAWQIAEVDFLRFKATGTTVYVDDGGAIPFLNPWSWDGSLSPQAQGNPAFPEGNSFVTHGGDARTELGPVLLEGYQGFVGQTSVFEWGKRAYQGVENGGISGIVYYSTTRAENDPEFGAGEPWEPGIPGVQVNLYASDVNGNKLALLDSVTSDSWDAAVPEACQVGSSEAFVFDPDGAAGPIAPRTIDCYDGLRVFNQVRPAVFDGGYAFGPEIDCPGGVCPSWVNQDPSDPSIGYIKPGYYVVEVIPPAGYEVVRSQDKNVDFGDERVPSSQLLPPQCVGAPYTVPSFLSANSDGFNPLPGVDPADLVPAPLAGQQLNLCDSKLVKAYAGANNAADFYLFTEVPIASHGYGFILDDTQNEFDPNSPHFGEKYAPPFMPISIRDWTGREIGRTLSDGYGVYNFLVPSTWSANLPQPSGMSPGMLTSCMNAKMRPVLQADGSTLYEPDPLHNPQYSQFCYTLQYMPGTTTYLDTPVIPVAAFAGADQFPLDCEFVDRTPRIFSVTNTANQGPFVTGSGQSLKVTSMGWVQVPNPEYQGLGSATPKTIARDYSFGCSAGFPTVTVNGVAAPVDSCGTDLLGREYIDVTVGAGTTTGQLKVTRLDSGLESINAVTVQVGLRTGSTLRTVTEGQSIQAAINAAGANDLILVAPGHYQEMVIMWKPVQLQGWGEGTTIDAVKAPVEALQVWRDYVAYLVTNGLVDLLPGQEAVFGGVEPAALNTEEGAGVLVLAKATGARRFGLARNRGARIDGFTITGADTGGGIIANGFAEYLEISNNRIINNSGWYGGGIRLGHPALVAPGQGAQQVIYPSAENNFVRIHNNYVGQNGGQSDLLGAGGGVSLCTGSDSYQLTSNYICGNFNQQEGGGVAHFGLSEGGLIADNRILFNESFLQAQTVSGGGLLITGAPAFGCPINPATGQPDPACLTDPTQVLSPGTGSLTVTRNLILGNAAEAGDGGGIRLNRVNGQDAASFPNQISRWHLVDLFNNMIAGNVSSLAGGGISLQDALRVNIMHNTIAQNDSTATAGEAFSAGAPIISKAQPGAGVVSHGHSAELKQFLPLSYPDFSNPTMVDNIVWQNRQFVFVGSGQTPDPNTGVTPFGLCPDLTSSNPLLDCAVAPAPFNGGTAVFDDLGVIGSATPGAALTCTSCVLDGGGVPLFVADHFNGNRQGSIEQPEVTSAIQTSAAFDEGGNFIRLRFGPLTLTDPATGVLFRNYHLQSTDTVARNLGLDLNPNPNRPAYPGLTTDYDLQVRPDTATGLVDIGADEVPANPGLGPLAESRPDEDYEEHVTLATE